MPRGLSEVVARPRRAWRRLRPLLGDRASLVVLLAGASVLTGFAEAGVLALVAQVAAAMVVDTTAVQADVGPFGIDLTIGAALGVAFALAIFRLGSQFVAAWLPACIAADVQARMRHDVFAAFSRASWPAQADEQEGHLQELMTSQVNQATQAVLAVATFLSAGAMFATMVFSALLLSLPVALVVLVAATAIFALLRPVTAWGRTSARDLSQANMDHAAGVSESVRLAEETQVFGATSATRARIGERIEAIRRAFFRFVFAGQLARTGYQSLAILLIVGGLTGLHALGVGDIAALGAAVLLLVRAGSYGQQLQGAYHGMNEMVPYLDRLDRAVERYEASTEPDGDQPLPTIRTLRFDAVSFAYRPDRPALRDVDFEIEAGEAVGVVGPSGAGKSTLVQILLRLRTPDSGAFLVNGEPASTFTRGDWQRRVAYVPQEPKVFDGSVADNIRYFRDLDGAAVERAARLAHVHDEIVAMPGGYDTVIGQRVDAVSGGQRQRICLARALAAEPDVLVLDEPTSALDMTSEAAVQESLAELHGEITMVTVAHRPSTLSRCDRVLVLRNGAVEAYAPIDQLSQTSDFFDEAIKLAGRPA